jgi:hypothetical protein
MKKLVTISDINFKGSPLCRYELNSDAVQEYAAAYQVDEKLPPPTLYHSRKNGLLVCDGMHRLTALQRNGVKQCLCEVLEGELESCFQAAVRGNLHHGVRRTNADKRQCVETAIHIYPEVADLKIAEICHVSHSTVAEVRKLLVNTGTITKREQIKTKDGKTRSAKADHKEKTLPNMRIRQSESRANPVPDTEAGGGRGVPGVDKGAANTPPVVDATGYPIPEKALACWERKDIAVGLIADLREVKNVLAGYAAAKDILMAEVNLNAADCELESLISRLQAAVPYAVCPMCQGKLPEKCKGCSGRGMVSKTKYERTDPALLKVRSMSSRKEEK